MSGDSAGAPNAVFTITANQFYGELQSIHREVGGMRSDLQSLSVQVSQMLKHLDDHEQRLRKIEQSKDEDHEHRISKLEQFRWRMAVVFGAVGLVAGLGGATGIEAISRFTNL
ncbi:hypothetical protein SAMN06265360_10613 [Haloechinothrix alba]|uniref:Haemolysin XhlA n=1 Tax=Haloechinothrix alba TaxID=664784 RepID=A0A238WBX8_9PSEU|nr:hypothetical protein [Haloechinothrix alba]SNR43998.1 hypothetical protein SAMN06265360_10613 [Haloechinothrix alba]